MGKISPKNQNLQITLPKDLVEFLDKIVESGNEQIQDGYKKLTRSKLIQHALCHLFLDIGEAQISLEKKKEVN